MDRFQQAALNVVLVLFMMIVVPIALVVVSMSAARDFMVEPR